MSFQKPVTDHSNKIYIAALVAAFSMIAFPTVAPVFKWLVSKEETVAKTDNLPIQTP